MYSLLYKKYAEEMQHFSDITFLDRNQFEEFAANSFQDMKNITVLENAKLKGVFWYQCWEDDKKKYCMIPVHGYYAENDRVLSKLFQQLAEDVVDDKLCTFFVNQYAHDDSSINLLHMMQFGTMAEKGIRRITKTNYSDEEGFDIRVLSKKEIEKNWSDIWINTNAIVTHLKSSPVFYEGSEFTEEIYKDFFMDKSTELIAAFHENKIIGIIEWNMESCKLICGHTASANVGEAYVIPQYRGSGLSKKLLEYAEDRANSQGIEYIWVEHGTANPNARGFWNKYFLTYQYELEREVRRW